MTITRKTFILLASVTLLSFGAAYFEHKLVTEPTFKELEARADRKDVERILTGFDALRHEVHNMAYDYALDNDTFRYFTERDPRYIQSNYVIDTFIGSVADMVILADSQENIIWFRFADKERERFYPADYFDPGELTAQLPDLTGAFPGAPISRSGLVQTAVGPLIFSAYSVHRSNGSGHSPGSLLIGRLLNQDALDEIQQLTKVSFAIDAPSENDIALFSRADLNKQYRSETNQFIWFIANIDSVPMLTLTLNLNDSSRTMYEITNLAVIAVVLTTFSWLVVVGYLNLSVVRPMLLIKRHLKEIRTTGNYYPRLGSQRHDEIGDLSNECDALTEQIERQNRQLAKQASELRKLSLEDPLTGLSNRRHLDQLLKDYWAIHLREKRALSLIMLDIDYFKAYNDNYGHQAGDDALEAVALTISGKLSRKSDKAARYGGEEFVILLPDTDIDGARKVAEDMRQAVRSLAIPHAYSDAADIITISIGCATLVDEDTAAVEELIKRADTALYHAKASGRDQIAVYEL